ncbi:hypothetical protein EYV94_04050 [Puteibacter caeruleilacunae]|nr:hypothetical protein EYV94_04050 [Puteibacter caeruleilacunae]
MRAFIKLTIISFFAAVCITACNSGKNDTTFNASGVTASSNEKPLVINLAVNDTYCKQTACACIHGVAAREYKEFQDLLKKEYNIDLRLTYFMEPYEMEEEMKAKTFDGVICKPWSAYMLSEEYQINYKRIADVLDAYNNQWLKGVFMVNKSSSIKTMDDIAGKVVVAGQKDAYEKYHSPLRLLENKGITPGRIYHKASCLESINELIDSKAEVAIVSDYVMTASCAVDIASPEDFRIIGETEDTPLTSVILDMDRVSAEDALRLQNALLALSGDKAPQSMLADGFVKPASWEPVLFTK